MARVHLKAEFLATNAVENAATGENHCERKNAVICCRCLITYSMPSGCTVLAKLSTLIHIPECCRLATILPVMLQI